jgi:hypothetical protein
MAETIVGIKLNASVSGAEQVKKLKEEIKAAEAEAKKIAKEFGESSKEAQKAAEKVSKLSQGLDSFKSIKTQIREATQEAVRLSQQFGEFSPEALAAAQRVANLKDQMDDFNERVQGLNPDKFQAISSVVQGIAGGIAAAQGAMALFGSDSEDLQKAMVRVQGAIALAMGVSQIMAAQNAFIGFFASIVSGLRVLSAAITTTGVGAILVGLGLAITGLIHALNEQSEAAEEAKKKNEDLAESLKELENDYKDVISQVDSYSRTVIAQMELEGKSESEIFQMRKQFAEQKIKLLQTERDEVEKNYVAQLNNLANQFSDQKEYDEAYKKLQKERSDAYKANVSEIGKASDDLRLLEIENLKKIQDEYKKRQAELKAQREKEAADALERRATLLALEQDTLAQQIAAADAAFATRIKGYKEKNFTEIEINKLRDAELEKVRTEFYAKQQAEQEKAAADRKALTDKEIADTVKSTDDFFKGEQLKNIGNNEALAQIEVQRLEAQIQNAKDYGQSTIDLELQLAQKRKEIKDKEVEDEKRKEQALHDIRMQGLQAASDVLNAMAGLMKEGSDAQKAFALAGIAVDTARAISSTIVEARNTAKNMSWVPSPGPQIAAAAVYASGLAQVLNNAKRARDILRGGGSGSVGGGGSVGAVGAAPSAMTPLTGGALPEEGQFGGMGRVYVLEGDITKTQTRVRRLRNTSVV